MRIRGIICALVLTATVAIAAGVPAQAQEKDKFIYAVPSAITSAIANFGFAMELGYFDEENIDPEFVPMAGSGVTIPQLLAGQIQSTGASLEPLIIARAPGGQDFPLIFVYDYLRNSVWEFAVLEDSDIQSFADLKGKTIGIVSLTAGNIYSTRAIVESAGVSWDDVETVPVGYGTQGFEALRTGTVDVLNLWDSQHEAMAQQGIKFRRLEVPDAYKGVASHGFEVTQKLLEENPDLIARFGRAVTKGSIACKANPEGCLLAYFRAFPDQRPANGTDEEVIAAEMPVMMARLRNITYFPEGAKEEYGAFSDRDWETLIDALKLGKQVPEDADIPLDSLYTNKLVPDFNDFDVEEVLQEAKAYK